MRSHHARGLAVSLVFLAWLATAFAVSTRMEALKARSRADPVPYVDPFAPPSAGELYAKEDPRVEKVFNEPDNVTTLSFTFWLNPAEGVRLPQGKKFIFVVPKNFSRSNQIDSITLIQRKPKDVSEVMDPIKKVERTNGNPVEYMWDFAPAWHVVRCRDTKKKHWHTWVGHHGRTKYAEPRKYRDPIIDDRRYVEPRDEENPDYDQVSDAARWMGQYPCDLFMVENTSPNTTLGAWGVVHGVIFNYRPFRGRIDRSLDQEIIFTKGTIFAEPDWGMRLPHFGGGRDQSVDEVKAQGSLYPGAKKLQMGVKYDGNYEKVLPWLTVNAGGMVIRLRANRLFAGCEIAMGGSQYDPSKPITDQVDKDGQVGISGGALAFAFMKSRNTSEPRMWLVQRYSVRAAGVMALDPLSMADVRIPQGTDPNNEFSSTFLRVDASHNFAYIMGVRCRYYRPSTVIGLPPSPVTPLPPPSSSESASPGGAYQADVSEADDNGSGESSESSASASTAAASGSASSSGSAPASGSGSTAATAAGAAASASTGGSSVSYQGTTPVSGGAPAASGSTAAQSTQAPPAASSGGSSYQGSVPAPQS